MKANSTGILALAGCLLLANPLQARAQSAVEDKPKAESRAEARPEARVDKVTPLKIEVVLTEYEGDKKLKSMPYVAYLNAYEGGRGGSAKLRVGSKVPILGGKDSGIQYIDVGTNIDYRATVGDAGTFRVELVVERSWVEGDMAMPTSNPSGNDKPPLSGEFKQPVIRQFKSDAGVTLRDGQTVESTVATDPLSGRVMKIEVSLAVLK
jgi:hypothetical protein